MDHTTFDALLRRVARQTTRRAALATLLGGALLLHDPAASDATKEAERRKHRRRKQAKSANLKPISFWIDNTAGTSPVTVEHGEHVERPVRCCNRINTVTIPPGERVRFASRTNVAYVWIEDYYWLSFANPLFQRPDVSAAYFGQPSGDGWCCQPTGFTVLRNYGLSVGETVAINIDGHFFRVRRDRDTNYKVFTVTLPATL